MSDKVLWTILAVAVLWPALLAYATKARTDFERNRLCADLAELRGTCDRARLAGVELRRTVYAHRLAGAVRMDTMSEVARKQARIAIEDFETLVLLCSRVEKLEAKKSRPKAASGGKT